MSSELLKNSRILLVEDQVIIAMDVEYILSEHGAATIDNAATVAEALAFIAAIKPDVAVLDLNLRIGTSLPVAEELQNRAIPFVFTTGYGDNALIPTAFADVPVVSKPYDATKLISALVRAIENQSKS